jgi:hypothetical protein
VRSDTSLYAGFFLGRFNFPCAMASQLRAAYFPRTPLLKSYSTSGSAWRVTLGRAFFFIGPSFGGCNRVSLVFFHPHDAERVSACG